MTWRDIQHRLGLTADGVPGPRTQAAVVKALDELDDLRAREDTQEVVLDSESRWMDIARGELGTREIVGPKHSERVLEYLATTSLGKWAASKDETPWCSAFVNWCMQQAGIEGTGSAAARSWLGWGLELAEPRVGCVVVLSRGAPPHGHVALLERVDGDHLELLGGNQHNSVSVQRYPRSRVLGYRWPAERAERVA